MIGSPSQIEANIATADFFEKMNFDNSRTLDTEANILGWITDNLSATDFTSNEDAVNQWEFVKARHLVAYEQNYAFYDALNLVNLSDFLRIIPTPEPLDEVDGCPECEMTFNHCAVNASVAYSEAKYSITNIMKANPTDQAVQSAGVILLAANKITYLSKMVDCRDSFDTCCPLEDK